MFLDTRFKGHKRFSLEGGEAALAIIDELLERAAAGGVQESVIGMAHRGRLSMLVNIVGKSMLQLFSEFDGDLDPDSAEGSGDVKYHLGACGVRHTSGRKRHHRFYRVQSQSSGSGEPGGRRIGAAQAGSTGR